MQLRYAQDSTGLLAERFAGLYTRDCTALLLRTPPEFSRNASEPTGGTSRFSKKQGRQHESLKMAPEFDARWVFNALRSTDADGIEHLGATIDGVNRLIALREFRFLDRIFEV